jgi:hypothetical protein
MSFLLNKKNLISCSYNGNCLFLIFLDVSRSSASRARRYTAWEPDFSEPIHQFPRSIQDTDMDAIKPIILNCANLIFFFFPRNSMA